MYKNKFVNILFVLALVLCTIGTGFMTSSRLVPIAPALKLSVTPSSLTVYPPIMIYRAQLSYLPPTPSAKLIVDFYNLTSTGIVTSTGLVYLGSAPVDRSGAAVLSKQIKAGTYTAVARIVINRQVVWSNKVTYKVP
jgi:hypothetical protein